MEDWISKDGKLVCSRCGIPIELGMPFKGEKLKWEGNRGVRDEFYDIANGYDRCRCLSSESRANFAKMMEDSREQARIRYEADSWKRRLKWILVSALALGIFLYFDFS